MVLQKLERVVVYMKTKTANVKDAKKVVKETKTQNKNEELVK